MVFILIIVIFIIFIIVNGGQVMHLNREEQDTMKTAIKTILGD